MIVLLKIILSLLVIADIFALRFVFQDFKKTRSQEGFDELPIFRRLRFNFISFFIMNGMISLIVFLMYFIFVKITLG
jgi:type II secretory pathway component PulF